jgi:hypothetical protein
MPADDEVQRVAFWLFGDGSEERHIPGLRIVFESDGMRVAVKPRGFCSLQLLQVVERSPELQAMIERRDVRIHEWNGDTMPRKKQTEPKQRTKEDYEIDPRPQSGRGFSMLLERAATTP